MRNLIKVVFLAMSKSLKGELQHILSGKSEVKFGSTIQTITSFLRRSQETSKKAEIDKHYKKEETKKLIGFSQNSNFWYDEIDFKSFVSEGAEQRVLTQNGILYFIDTVFYLKPEIFWK